MRRGHVSLPSRLGIWGEPRPKMDFAARKNTSGNNKFVLLSFLSHIHNCITQCRPTCRIMVPDHAPAWRPPCIRHWVPMPNIGRIRPRGLQETTLEDYHHRRATGGRWWRGIVVKTAGSAGVLSLSCARLTAGRVTTLWVKRPLSVSQQGRLSLPSVRGR